MAGLYMASMVTVGFMASFLVFFALLVGFYMGAIPAIGVAILIVLFNLAQWLIGPWFMDLMQRWLYNIRDIDLAELRRMAPRCADIFEDACRKHNLPVPRLKIIGDNNPTAFTYGSYPSNARVVFSEGLLHYCSEEEAAAVLCHELGHIKHYDFVLMTVVTTIIQLMYLAYVGLRMASRRTDKAGKQLAIAAIACYFVYFISQYLVLYLSRTREYMADRFAGETTGDPDALSSALVKIAYGIAAAPHDERSMRMLESTRALNISDFKSSMAVGETYGSLTGMADRGSSPKKHDPSTRPDIEKVFLFDILSPWAKVAEFSSTHPLTGRRIAALSDQTSEMGRAPRFKMDHVAIRALNVDRSKLYSRFAYEVVIYFLPHIGLFAGLLFGLISPPLAAAAIVGLGIGMLLKGAYSFPFHNNFKKTTLFECLCDPFASPLRGMPIEVSGTLIGKASSGAKFGEDVMIQDSSGVLSSLNYESPFGFIGNLFAGGGKMTRVIGSPGTARGWFRRSAFHHVDLKDLATSGPEGTINSWTRFWAVFGGALITIIGLVALAFLLAL